MSAMENTPSETIYPEVRARVRAERLQVMFEQAPPAIAISVIVGVMVCVVLWEVTDHRLLGPWLGALAELALVRVTMVVAYARRTPSTPAAVVRWERWFIATALMVGTVWGTGGWLLMPRQSLAHQAMLYFFLMGLVGGTVATYGAHALLVSASISLILLPATFWLLTVDSTELHLMALGGFIYMVAAYRATRLLAFFLARSFELSHDLALARVDGLTGLNNRRAFLELASLSLQQENRYGRPVSVIVIDLDRFKAINDERGHAAGDDVLRSLAATVKEVIRISDVSGRLGGEEFAILLPETPARDAVLMAERLRAAISDVAVRAGSSAIRFTASFGVAELNEHDGSLDALLARGDAALYQAKLDGRNRVHLSTRNLAALPAER
ncbi:MAG: GGDEF domain-containing protein [Gemmatimonadetes bacterium]|nr:GGDEF domain-containing protein [Gemmatimonadota bacterium]